MRVKDIYKAWLLFCCMLCLKVLNASDRPVISYLGIEQGLSNNSVTCAFRDHSGLMWFGTYDGLNRYDGYYFKIFRNQLDDENSLPNNRISTITEDAQHRIWIGTRVGVGRYDEVTSAFTPVKYIPFGEKKSIKIAATVNDIKIAADGNIFIATDENLLLYKEQNDVSIPLTISGMENEHIPYQALSVEIDDHHRTWVYVRDIGLCLYNPESNMLEIVNREIKNGICLKSDGYGNLWMGTDDGLFNYSTQTNKYSKRFSSIARIVQLSKYGNSLFIASDGNGIFTFDYTTKKIDPFFPSSAKNVLTSQAVNSVLKDIDGRFWIGTLRGGINVIDPEKNRFQTVEHDPLNADGLPGNVVISFCEDPDGNLWIGTDGAGISCWNRRQNHFVNYRYEKEEPQSLSNNSVTCLLRDYRNEIWIATWGGGINRFNRQTKSFQHFHCVNEGLGKEDKDPFLLYQDKQKQLWAGTCLEGGLYRFNRKLEQFELYDESLKNILTMSEDHRGSLWAGDFSSLIKMDLIHKRHLRYKIGYAIRSIHEDKKGNFWIGTEGGGLLLFDRNTGNYLRFTEKEGLSNNSILNILEDKENNLWISTFNGLCRFNTATRKFILFSQSDGLQSNQFSYNAGLELRSGEFAFGGIKGLNIFYPDRVINSSRPLTVLLTGLKANNIDLQGGNSFEIKRTKDWIKSITLPYGKAALTIDFVALNYSGSDKIKYAYYLEGWDKGWNYVGKLRTANYTRLNEGSYIFHVKAVDAEGVWTGMRQNLVIVVLPPWYRSWWAYLLYVIIAVSLIYIYVQYKSQRARQSYEIALAKVETENEKRLNEKKLSFFTNISHEFRSPLTLIIDPVKELLCHPEKNARAADLQIVYRNARRLLSLVDQLLLFRKADAEGGKLKLASVEFRELCREIFVCFSYQAKVKNICYEFSAEGHSVELLADREKMEIILFNLLSNAIKFTPHGGKVTMEILEKPGIAEIIITDTGSGIDPNIGDELFEKFYQVKERQPGLNKGFGIGLYLVKQFVQAHRGSIRYEGNTGGGTRFVVCFPVRLPDEKNDPVRESRFDGQDRGKAPVIIEELMADMAADIEENHLLTERNMNGGKAVSATIPEIVSERKAILLVDDNIGIRQYLSRIFGDRFLVYEAGEGETGFQMAVKYMPDIIISDVIMEGMNGVEFCHRIKADPDLNHIPVILLTATTSPDIKLKGIECGAEDFITKPFEKGFLIARVDNILKNRNTLQQYFLDTVTLRKNKTKVSAAYRDFLDRCMTIVEKHIDNEDFTIKTFAHEMGMSHSNLYKKVKSVSGISINAFIRFLRLRKAALLLLSSDTNINEAAFQVGICDPKYFREQFHKLFGMNPSDYIKKYKGSFNKEVSVII